MLLIAGAIFVAFGPKPASAQATASLTVFTGTVNVKHGNGGTAAGHSGDSVAQGDILTSGPNSKLAVNFPDGSITRIDSNSELTIQGLARSTNGSYQMNLEQGAGKTWNSVKQLLGGSSFRVKTPNNGTAEVRGTDFEVIVETLADGTKTVRVDTFTGSVAVQANGASQIVSTGQSTSVAQNAAPTPPAPISAADRTDSWTVFNLTVNQTPGQPVGFNTGTLNQGQTGPVQPGPAGDGKADLNFTLGWPGSTFELIVFGPDGAEFQRNSSSTPSVSISVPAARAGAWTYQVRDLQSAPNEVWWVVASKVTKKPSPSPSPSASPSPAATPVATPSPVLSPSPSPSESASPSPNPSPSALASLAPSPTPVPSSSPAASPSPVPSATPSASPPPSPSPAPSASPSPSPSPSPTPTTSPPPPALSATAAVTRTAVDLGDAVTFTGSAANGTAPYSYSWAFGDGALSTAQNPPAHTYATTGSYVATLTVTDNVLATATSMVGVIVNALPTVTVTASPNSGSVPLVVALSAVRSGGTAGFTYSWNFGDGTTGTGATPSHTYTAAGTYSPSVSVTDSVSHSTTANATVNATPSTVGAVAAVILSATPSTILSDGSSTSTIVATAKDTAGNPVVAVAAITISLSVSDTTVCALTGTNTTIAAGASTSVAAPGTVSSTTTAGSCSVGGSATGGYTAGVTGVTITSTNQSISLPASVLAPPAGATSFPITLSPAAPAGGLTVNLATLNSGIATVSSTVAFAAGASSGTAILSGITTGQTTLTASAVGYATRSTVASVKLITVGFTPTGNPAVPATWTVTRQVQLSDAAPPGGLVIGLALVPATGIATVSPGSVVVPEGQLSSPAFTITGVAAGATILTGSSPGAVSGSVTVNVSAAPSLTFSTTGNSIGTGLYRNVSVYLSDPAPAPGVTITLTPVDATKIGVPATVTVPAGQTTAPFKLNGLAVGSSGLTAASAGWQTATASYNVTQSNIAIYNQINTARNTLDTSNYFSVVFNTPGCGLGCDYASADIPITFTVAGSPTTIVLAPAPSTLTAGNWILGVNVGQATAGGTYSVTATALGLSATTSLVTVTQPSLSFSTTGNSIGTSLYRNITVYLSNPAPVGGLVVALTPVDATKIGVPATISVLAGQSSAPFKLNGLAVGSSGLAASAPGWQTATASYNVTQSNIAIYNQINTSRTTLDTSNYFSVVFNTPGCGVGCDYASADIPITFTVAGSPTTIVPVPAASALTAGNWILGVNVGQATAGGTYTITATALGLSATTSVVTVTQPSLSLSGNNTWVGAGLHRNYNVYLSNPAPAGGLAVSLGSTNSSIITVPASAIVPAGQTSYSFPVSGVVPGSVQVTASAASWQGASITVSASTPSIQVYNQVATARTTLESNSFTLVFNTPGCGLGCDYLNADTVISFAVAGTAGIVATPAAVVFPAGNWIQTINLPAASGSGTVSVSATAFGYGSATTALVSVTQPYISLGTPSPIGAGLYRAVTVSLSDPAPAGGLTVTFTPANGKIAVPAPVTIGAGSSSTSFVLSGVAAGTVGLTAATAATAPGGGWTSGTALITVNTPTFTFQSLPGTRTTTGGAAAFTVQVYTPGCGVCDYATAPITVNFSIASSPPGIQAAPASVTVAAGQYQSAAGSLAAPTAVGTYNVIAAASGFSSGASPSVTVTS